MNPLHIALAGLALSFPAIAPPALAQQPPPLTYVQPLPPQAVTRVQERLRATGAYRGAADGIWGPESQAALESYQQRNGLQIGPFNAATATMLGLSPGELAAATAPAPVALMPEPLPPAAVRNIQWRLRASGFYGGVVDGVWGPGTQAALERFQASRGLQPAGQMGPATAQALGLDPGNLAAARPY